MFFIWQFQAWSIMLHCRHLQGISEPPHLPTLVFPLSWMLKFVCCYSASWLVVLYLGKPRRKPTSPAEIIFLISCFRVPRQLSSILLLCDFTRLEFNPLKCTPLHNTRAKTYFFCCTRLYVWNFQSWALEGKNIFVKYMAGCQYGRQCYSDLCLCPTDAKISEILSNKPNG